MFPLPPSEEDADDDEHDTEDSDSSIAIAGGAVQYEAIDVHFEPVVVDAMNDEAESSASKEMVSSTGPSQCLPDIGQLVLNLPIDKQDDLQGQEVRRRPTGNGRDWRS